MSDSPEEEAALDADEKAYHADDPIVAIVPCIWDSKQQIYVPVYSHRGVEITDRIETLEAALREIKGVASQYGVKSGPACAMRNIARAALKGENKDG
jgi:hypothetical protein